MLSFICKKLVSKDPSFRTAIPKIIAIFKQPHDIFELIEIYNNVKFLTEKVDDNFMQIEKANEGEDDWKTMCRKQIELCHEKGSRFGFEITTRTMAHEATLEFFMVEDTKGNRELLFG